MKEQQKTMNEILEKLKSTNEKLDQVLELAKSISIQYVDSKSKIDVELLKRISNGSK